MLQGFNKQEAVNALKNEIKKERIISLDFSYIKPIIENWWQNKDTSYSNHMLKLQLISLFISNLKENDLYYFDKLGINNIAGICITHIFEKDCEYLSLIVHEALSELFHLKDIKYSYEEHKALYLKPSGENYRDWGNGYGEITPHSDDLYEDIETDYLSLTVCRDLTKTPTLCFFPKDILNNFSDNELNQFSNMKVRFISGKNIQIVKIKERNILEYCPKYGFKFFMDFRIDNNTGKRMLPIDKKDEFLIIKLRKNLLNCSAIKSVPNTGTFFIMSNYKVLHARAQLNINKKLAINIANNSSLSNTPRLLYRSKGPRASILIL